MIAIHKRHGLKPNPLYLRGASRVGCWPCINAKKSEIRHIAETDPGRIDMIRDLEHEVDEAAQARHAAKGETRESLGFSLPTFFQGPTQDAPGSRKRSGWSIDKVVAWSKTSRGGVHLELFAAPNDGCARWGMCEALDADTRDTQSQD